MVQGPDRVGVDGIAMISERGFKEGKDGRYFA